MVNPLEKEYESPIELIKDMLSLSEEIIMTLIRRYGNNYRTSNFAVLLSCLTVTFLRTADMPMDDFIRLLREINCLFMVWERWTIGHKGGE